jgi:hypothetical protein
MAEAGDLQEIELQERVPSPAADFDAPENPVPPPPPVPPSPPDEAAEAPPAPADPHRPPGAFEHLAVAARQCGRSAAVRCEMARACLRRRWWAGAPRLRVMCCGEGTSDEPWERPRTAKGWATFVVFDLGTVAVSVTDVVTDMSVMTHYYRKGYMSFFYLSASIFGLSSLIFSMIFIGVFVQGRFKLYRYMKETKKWPKSVNLLIHALLCLVLAPVGQVFPVWVWAAETFWPQNAAPNNNNRNNNGGVDRDAYRIILPDHNQGAAVGAAPGPGAAGAVGAAPGAAGAVGAAPGAAGAAGAAPGAAGAVGVAGGPGAAAPRAHVRVELRRALAVADLDALILQLQTDQRNAEAANAMLPANLPPLPVAANNPTHNNNNNNNNNNNPPQPQPQPQPQPVNVFDDDDATQLRLANHLLRWEGDDPLRAYLKQQAAKHAPFVAEAICESIPQSLVQLVALIVIGQSEPDHVDWVSVFSIVLSILSIVSKSYIVSISMIREIFTFKMLAICYDVVCLFYIFASLFLTTGDGSGPENFGSSLPLLRPVGMEGGRHVDTLSFVWIWSTIALSAWLFLAVRTLLVLAGLFSFRMSLHTYVCVCVCVCVCAANAKQ